MSEILFPKIVTNVDGMNQGLDLVSHALVNREIYLTGEINDLSALNVITQLRFLAKKSTDDICLYISSPGGSVPAGLEIYDMIRHELDCDVSTICIGMAASMGALLLAAGTKGKRYAAPNAEIMIHQPLGGVQGQVSDIALVAEHACAVKKKLAGILADATGKDIEQILRDTERDNWLSAQQAKQYGLVDHVGFPGRLLDETAKEE